MHTPALAGRNTAALVAGRRASVARELQRLRALDRQLASLGGLHACDAVRAPGYPERCLVIRPSDPSRNGGWQRVLDLCPAGQGDPCLFL